MAATEAEFCPTVLETARLKLRPLAETDIPAIVDLAGAWEVARYTLHIPHPYAEGDARGWLAAVARGHAEGRQVTLAIADRATGALMGAVALILAPDRRRATLGYWLGRPFWGRGLMAEAVTRLVRHGFDALGLDEVAAAHHPDNAASRRVLEKAGFERAGEGVEAGGLRGAPMPSLRWRLPRAVFGARHPLKLVLVAAVALVDIDGRVLIAQRPPGKAMAGLWEFPGGKLQPGETPEVALVRELKEELGIDTQESCLGAFTFASHGYGDFHLLMPLYLCRKWHGTPTAHEHTALKWVRPDRLADYPMPPADIPLVAMLRDFL